MELFRLRVENLGRIADAELSIRPLTVFVGPNNTNKTWTAYALYGLAQRLCLDPRLRLAPSRTPVADLVEIDAAFQRIIEDTAARFVSSPITV